MASSVRIMFGTFTVVTMTEQAGQKFSVVFPQFLYEFYKGQSRQRRDVNYFADADATAAAAIIINSTLHNSRC